VRALDLDPTRLEELAHDVLGAALAWTQGLDERSVKPDSSGSALLSSGTYFRRMDSEPRSRSDSQRCSITHALRTVASSVM
jgi:hypothetical protein